MFISFRYHLLYYKYAWISNYNQYSPMYSVYPYIMYNIMHTHNSQKKDCNNYRGISLLPTMYKILSNILLSMQRKFLGIIIVESDATGQLLITYSAFVKYLRKNRNTIVSL